GGLSSSVSNSNIGPRYSPMRDTVNALVACSPAVLNVESRSIYPRMTLSDRADRRAPRSETRSCRPPSGFDRRSSARQCSGLRLLLLDHPADDPSELAESGIHGERNHFEMRVESEVTRLRRDHDAVFLE